MSSLVSYCLVLRNHNLAERAIKDMGSKGPEFLNEAERKELFHVCVVLQAFRSGTKLLEGGGTNACASIYKPTMHLAKQKLSTKREMPVPEELAGFEGYPASVDPEDSVPIARQLRIWTYDELMEGQKKHLEGTSGENMLDLMTFLDVRFKSHACIKDKVKDLEKVWKNWRSK